MKYVVLPVYRIASNHASYAPFLVLSDGSLHAIDERLYRNEPAAHTAAGDYERSPPRSHHRLCSCDRC